MNGARRILAAVALAGAVAPPIVLAAVPVFEAVAPEQRVRASDFDRSHRPPPFLTAGAKTPVLLVPGWSDGREELLPLRSRFLGAGWDADRVGAIDFQDPDGSNLVHAEELAREVARELDRTGAARVDIVAHSMGGLAVRRYLLDGGASAVRKVVFLATPQRGTLSASLAWGEGAREMEPGSAFLAKLVRARPVPEGVRAITIRTPLDLHVIPQESATLPGIQDLEVCCPTHAGLLDDDEVFRAIERFLRE